MDKPYTAAGRIIKIARNRTGIKQSELADKVGTIAPHISRWETGEHKPSKKYAKKICHELNIDEDELQEAYNQTDYLEHQKEAVSAKFLSSSIAEKIRNTAYILEQLPLNKAAEKNVLESLIIEINKAIQQLQKSKDEE